MSDQENELEAALAKLRPAGVEFDVVQLAYEAGRREAGRRGLVWPVVCGLLATGLLAALVVRPATPRPVERIVYVNQAAPPATMPMLQPMPREEPSPAVAAAAGYIALRDAVLARGLDALPAPPRGGGSMEPIPRAWGPARWP